MYNYVNNVWAPSPQKKKNSESWLIPGKFLWAGKLCVPEAVVQPLPATHCSITSQNRSLRSVKLWLLTPMHNILVFHCRSKNVSLLEAETQEQMLVCCPDLWKKLKSPGGGTVVKCWCKQILPCYDILYRDKFSQCNTEATFIENLLV